MKRLVTLALAIILLTGCNAMKPNMEEAELLWRETEKRIEAWTLPTKAQSNPTETLLAILEPEDETPQETSTPAEEATPRPPTILSSPKPIISEPESIIQPEQAAPKQEEKTEIIDWPYITCPLAPTSTPTQDWPYITAPEPPTYTPEPEPTEPPQEQPAPTPILDVPVDPTPEPIEPPADPMPEPPTEQPSTGYAECSCGARLTPDELVPHMKAHALNGESHSYRAY